VELGGSREFGNSTRMGGSTREFNFWDGGLFGDEI